MYLIYSIYIYIYVYIIYISPWCAISESFQLPEGFQVLQWRICEECDMWLANQWLETSHNSHRSSVCEHSAPQPHLQWTAYSHRGHEWRQWLHLCSKVQFLLLYFWVSLCVRLSVYTRYEHENEYSVWLDHTLHVLWSYSNASALTHS